MGSQKNMILDEQTVVDQLLCLGFIPAKAHALASQIELNEYSGHQTTLQWAEDHINSQFKYNILLAGKGHEGSTKPFNKTGEYNEEFDIPTGSEDDAVSVRALDTFMLMKNELSDVPWLTDFTTEQANTLQGTRFWFHGTDAYSVLSHQHHQGRNQIYKGQAN